MLRFLVIAAAIVGAISAATDAEWAVFKATHGKVYNQRIEGIRRMIWEDNMRYIKEHNELYAKGKTSFYLGENEYADMTSAEFVKVMNGFGGLRASDPRPPKIRVNPKVNASLPTEVNWVTKGYVTPVKNQGQCGSCWSFSSTGALEGANFKKTGRLVSLSEKNLMDCSWSYGNEGCNGGWMDWAFKYVIANKGIDTEASYPYYPRSDRTCHFQPNNVGGNDTGYYSIKTGDENALQLASATVGPISVAIDATRPSFQLYRGGVYYEPTCSPTNLDHAVLVVGYGTEQGEAYWLVKNSWGSYWGEKGYIKMIRNYYNNCGIATHARYPVV